jgi:glycosyltransferase involved in cell wall biosynthesis
MKILYLTDNPTLGGTIRILQGWLPLMPARGLCPHVVTPPGSDFLRWLEQHGVSRTTCPMPWPSRHWPFPGLYHAWRIARWARRRGVAVIHCNEHNIYPFCTLLRRFLPRPLVCHVRYKLERGFAEWAFGRPSRRPDVLLWTSRQQLQDSEQAIAGLVPASCQHLIPLGLDLDSFGNRHETREATRAAWGFRPNEVVVGQACALRPRKRLEEFVELVARLAAEDERVVGVLAGDARPGDEPYRDRIVRMIQETGLGRRFRWVGNLDDIEPFEQAIDLFISTSEYETFGNSVCEAMACGRPIIAYRGGSVAEVVGPGGLIVENGDLDGLTRVTRELVEKDDLRRELGRTARQRVAQEFNTAATLARLETIYRRLTESGLGATATVSRTGAFP